MPDPVTPNPSSPPAPERFAGKYADDAAAFRGVNEIRKAIGLDELPADKPLYGENGHFKDRASAEGQYKEHERIYHATRPPKPNAANADLSIKPEEKPTADVAPEMVMQKAGLSTDDVDKAIRAGGLTPEQIKAIRAAEPSYRNLTDQNIQLIAKGRHAEIMADQARRLEIKTKAYDVVGGQQQHDAIVAWAKANVPADELAQLNTAIQQHPTLYGAVVRDFAARYNEAIKAGKVKPLATGTVTAAAGVPSNRQEFAELMNKVNRGDRDATVTLARMTDSQIAAFN